MVPPVASWLGERVAAWLDRQDEKRMDREAGVVPPKRRHWKVRAPLPDVPLPFEDQDTEPITDPALRARRFAVEEDEDPAN